ncbi:sodium/solute symporter [Macrococcoides bohemicum]|uniref:Cation acetate symporter n=1 Tax=Macrococcoides bohemicum TaxID=1903056 RepID=A0A328A944_9STAP|nr:sodium/solute symporter [Macrococcus bohemicus]QYA42532.1 sodium/solute symporter [Macrococcus bohemicus]QYA44916.1 sodium/solute symporter [Macrococcus bohemicus]RAK49838.1 cation acetate symporter [Macrococcus bohemicus]
MNMTVIIMFLFFVSLTLLITYFASKRTNSAEDFYTAGGGLTGWQNGLAIAGDYLSAASFLGIAGAIALWGFDGFFYSIGYLTAYLIVLYIVAEPLRNLGKYTLADMIAARFELKKVRAMAAVSSITIVIFYMLAQLVGAGALIQLLFNIPYTWAVIIVGIMMTVYVLFGGMTATSWVQMVKAILLMVGTLIISFLVLKHFNFSIAEMFGQMKNIKSADFKGEYINPGSQGKSPLDNISLIIALLFGTAGLPHILMRFFTVSDAKTARSSVMWATWIIGIFYILTIFLGFGAASLLSREEILKANPAGNMAAPLLADKLGGDLLMSFVCAVAFATILAVVAGLVLSGASAFAHDIYGEIIKKGNISEKEQMSAAKIASLAVAILSIILALFAQNMNVAFLVSLAFCVAASANLPVIVYTIFWKRFNTQGAIAGIVVGLLTSIILVILSPNVMNPAGTGFINMDPIFPLANPAIISVPAGFIAAFLGTFLGKADTEEKFKEVQVKSVTGIATSEVTH